MDLALNNLQRVICPKPNTQPANQSLLVSNISLFSPHVNVINTSSHTKALVALDSRS